MQSFVRRHWGWNCNDVSVWRGLLRRQCAAIASSFFISVFPNPKSELGNTLYSFWGCVVSQGTVYHLSTGTASSRTHKHPRSHYSMSSLSPRFTKKHSVPFLSAPSLTHPHTCPLSVFELYMQCPETRLHAQLMSLLSRWLTLANSHSQALPKFHSPPASSPVLSSLLGFR